MFRRRSDAFSKPYNHAGPLDGWELTRIAQFEEINEAGNTKDKERVDHRPDCNEANGGAERDGMVRKAFS